MLTFQPQLSYKTWDTVFNSFLNAYLKILDSNFPLIKKRKKAAQRLPGLPPELEFHVQINETCT